MPVTSKKKSENTYIIAVDFDGMITQRAWPEIGELNDENLKVHERMRKAKKEGAYIIIWTCRSGDMLNDVISWLNMHPEIPYDAINENAPWIIESFGHDPRKIFANEYWDDRGVSLKELTINSYARIGGEIGDHVNLAQQAYGDSFTYAGQVIRIYLSKYRNPDGTYTIPDELIDHLLVQTRIIDKQFRIFSNPKGDLMKESPYKDITGYGILGVSRFDIVGGNINEP